LSGGGLVVQWPESCNKFWAYFECHSEQIRISDNLPTPNNITYLLTYLLTYLGTSTEKYRMSQSARGKTDKIGRDS